MLILASCIALFTNIMLIESYNKTNARKSLHKAPWRRRVSTQKYTRFVTRKTHTHTHTHTQAHKHARVPPVFKVRGIGGGSKMTSQITICCCSSYEDSKMACASSNYSWLLFLTSGGYYTLKIDVNIGKMAISRPQNHLKVQKREDWGPLEDQF